jgi:hypothetical protein
MEKILPTFDEYQTIFRYINDLPSSISDNRLTLSEWLKFSYQLDRNDEQVKSSLIGMMINYVQEVQNSFQDYQHLLKGPFNLDANGEVIDAHRDNLDLEMVGDEDDDVLELEILEFKDLGVYKDNCEYMKPFSFEAFTRDSDDVC